MENHVGSPYIHSLETKHFQNARIVVFDPQNSAPVTCLIVGDITSSRPPLVRIQSRCLYSEVLGAVDCDCHAQMELSFELIKAEGSGIFIYLEQEGRGCGLISKAKAYVLKDKFNLDTVKAYLELGLDVDPRQYDAAAEALKYLDVSNVRLLTNNPRKIEGLINNEIKVEQIHLRTLPTTYNLDYLRVKQTRLGQDLGLKD